MNTLTSAFAKHKGAYDEQQEGRYFESTIGAVRAYLRERKAAAA